MNKQFIRLISAYVDSQDIALWCASLHEEYPFSFKITRKRNTKLGDYSYRKDLRGQHHQISINHDLNKHQFLFTFLHEVAHRVCMECHGQYVKAHGKEWKSIFSALLGAALAQKFFPQSLVAPIQQHAENPRASCGADPNLYKSLSYFDSKQQALYLTDLKSNTLFLFNKKCFRKLEMKRSRALCVDISNNKKYFISGIAEVIIIEDK